MLSEIFGPDLFVVPIFLVVVLGLFALAIFAIIDASSHSKEDFYVAGYSKTAWILVIAIATLFSGFGVILAAYYLIAVRPKVRRIEATPGARTSLPGGRDESGPFCSSCGAPAAGEGRYCSGCGRPILH
jgi:hypothetical protein